jgi:hypothetical protein
MSGFYLQYSKADDRFALSMIASDSTSATPTRALAGSTPVIDSWYHLVGVRDATNNQIKLYVNGVLADTESYSARWNAGGSTVIGRARAGISTDFFPGTVDEVHLIEGALGDTDVQYYYRYPGGPGPIPGWHLGEADGDGLPDDWETSQGLDMFSASGPNGANGDPDHDGIPNLAEYGLHLNAASPDAAGLPTTAVERSTDGHPYLIFRYRRRIGASSLSYRPEITHDMVTWSSTSADFEEITPAVPNADGVTETVKVRAKPAMDAPGTSRTAVRLRIGVN